jgi:hypothetical protein
VCIVMILTVLPLTFSGWMWTFPTSIVCECPPTLPVFSLLPDLLVYVTVKDSEPEDFGVGDVFLGRFLRCKA